MWFIYVICTVYHHVKQMVKLYYMEILCLLVLVRFVSVIMFVRYRHLTDELQLERDALQATVSSSEIELQQRSAEVQQLQDKVKVNCLSTILQDI